MKHKNKILIYILSIVLSFFYFQTFTTLSFPNKESKNLITKADMDIDLDDGTAGGDYFFGKFLLFYLIIISPLLIFSSTSGYEE